MGGDGAASSMANKCRRLNPSSLPTPGAGASPPTGSDFKDSLLESFLLSSHSLEVSFEKLVESMSPISERDSLIDRARSRGTALIRAAERCVSKKATAHNFRVWNLPDDLTVKILSMLDVESLCCAAASCTLFCKCHMDPSCYVDIDLRVALPKVSNELVSTMTQRAAGALRSLKLGIRPGRHDSSDFSDLSWREKMLNRGKKISYLTGDCLYSLARKKSNRLLLRTLHLRRINKMSNAPVRDLLSLCPLLLDLEIVDLQRIDLRTIVNAVSKYCHSLERLFFQESRTLMGSCNASLVPSTCANFVKNCPSLTSLSIRGCWLDDHLAEILFKGFKRLKHLDLSRCIGFTGTFLRDPILCQAPVEVLILRDCSSLREDEINWFLDSVRRGDFPCLRHIDLWIAERLRSEDFGWSPKDSVSCALLKDLAELRPDITVVANSSDGSPQSDEWSDNDTDSSIFSSDSSPSSSHGDEGSNHTVDALVTSSDRSSGGREDSANE